MRTEQPFSLFYNTWMTHEGKIHNHDKKWAYFRNTFEDLTEAQITEELSYIEWKAKSLVGDLGGN